ATAQVGPWCPDEIDDLVREVTVFLQHRASVLLVSQEQPPWDLPAADGGENKRQRIEALIKEGTGGHTWEAHPTAIASAACVVCGLCIKQLMPLWRFDRIAAHPCRHTESPIPAELE
ncbi:unnamed protein product, partial [Symbiodinium sp. CCMP2592]